MRRLDATTGTRYLSPIMYAKELLLYDLVSAENKET
jgi:hypothetical protein